MQILVSVRSVYGNQTVYPVCEKAKLFASLAKAKTLTWDAVEKIKALGYAVAVQPTVEAL